MSDLHFADATTKEAPGLGAGECLSLALPETPAMFAFAPLLEGKADIERI
jgi:hypothetical protein